MRSTWSAIVLLFTLRCKESTELVSAGFERTLSPLERWALRLHFISCRYCHRFQRQLELIQQATRNRANVARQLSPMARRKILAAIEVRCRGRDR